MSKSVLVLKPASQVIHSPFSSCRYFGAVAQQTSLTKLATFGKQTRGNCLSLKLVRSAEVNIRRLKINSSVRRGTEFANIVITSDTQTSSRVVMRHSGWRLMRDDRKKLNFKLQIKLIS